MALSPTDGETFMREVDDAVRADFFERFFRNYGKLTLAVIVAALLALGGWLYWRHHEQTVADANGRAYSAVIDALANNRPRAAANAAEAIAKGDSPAYRVLARMAQGAAAEVEGNATLAAQRYAAAANDLDAPPAMRQTALLREVLLQFDTLAPDAVIARLSSVVADNASPAFPAAAELTALAQVKKNNRTAAIALYRRIAAHSAATPSLKRRANQMVANLGAQTNAPATRPAAAATAAARPAAPAAAAPAAPAR
ncbi:MAG: tetratricopeptide repeat protein [Sphingomonadaceae bacterium]|nr:tetratricopeptide repeat protein [Sphingomonadaceae bacterium]